MTLNEGRPRVLLADDSERFRTLVRSILGRAGFDITEAVNGRRALTLAAQLDPDVVLLDWKMPEGGLSVAKELIERYGMVDRVIMLTALDDLRDVRAAREIGVSAYIVKPPDPDELRAVVDAAAIASTSQRTGRGAAGASRPVRARHLALADPPPERDDAVDPDRVSVDPATVRLDSATLHSLGVLGPTELRELMSAVVEIISGLLDELPSRLAEGDFDAVRKDAHRGVNESVAVGATELAKAFVALQDAARHMEADAATSAAADVSALWPATRTAIVALLGQPTAGHGACPHPSGPGGAKA